MTEDELHIIEDHMEEIQNCKQRSEKMKAAAERAALAAQQAHDKYYQLLCVADIIVDQVVAKRIFDEQQNPTPTPNIAAFLEQKQQRQMYG
jgi:hypothetical protein